MQSVPRETLDKQSVVRFPQPGSRARKHTSVAFPARPVICARNWKEFIICPIKTDNYARCPPRQRCKLVSRIIHAGMSCIRVEPSQIRLLSFLTRVAYILKNTRLSLCFLLPSVCHYYSNWHLYVTRVYKLNWRVLEKSVAKNKYSYKYSNITMFLNTFLLTLNFFRKPANLLEDNVLKNICIKYVKNYIIYF